MDAVQSSEVGTRVGNRVIVIDGQNVSSHHNPFNNGYQNVHALQLVIEYWIQKAHPCVAFVPALWLQSAMSGAGTSGDASKLDRLRDMASRELVYPLPPPEAEEAAADEPFLVTYAKRNNCVVVTMDMFATAIRRKKSEEEREALRAWVRRYTMPYTFIGDSYLPDPEFQMPTQPWLELESMPTGGHAGSPLEGLWSPTTASNLAPVAKSGSPSALVEMDFDEESPAVAVFRRQQVQGIMAQICDLKDQSGPGLGGESAVSRPRYSFLTRKVAADVFNKWVFQMNATGHGTRSSDVEDGGWTLTGSALDPVIPSTEIGSLTSYIKMQLVSGYHVTESDASAASKDLSWSCIAAAQRVAEYAKADLKQRRKIGSGRVRQPNDAAGGVTMEHGSSGEGEQVCYFNPIVTLFKPILTPF